MMTLTEKDGWIKWCKKNEATGEMPIKDFFTGSFLSIIDDTTVFVNDFQNLALFFIKALTDADLSDSTDTELSYTGNHKLDRGTFKYILSGDNLSFYSISYRVREATINLYEAKNLVPAKIEDVCDDFGGEAHIALYRACILMRSFAPKATTVASCAYSHWKKKYSRFEFEKLFPECGEKAEKLCRAAYHGGLCYMSEKAVTISKPGIILDENSLYPYVMHKSIFAIGKEHYGEGEVPENIRNSNMPYYVHFRARFNLKDNHVPFLRTRCDNKHWNMEILTTSKYLDPTTNTWYDAVSAPGCEWVDEWGEIHFDSKPMMVELCLYRDEYELMFEQYDVTHIEYIDYVWWKGARGIFTEYVDEFYEMKKNAKGKAERRIGKTLQNGLSGRLSSKKKRSSAYLCKDIADKIKGFNSFDSINKRNSQYGKYTNPEAIGGISCFIDGAVESESRSVSHIQIGAAITSIAMCDIVRKAQANYEHFLYTDTDSLHLDCDIDSVKDCTISDKLGDFKIEHRFLYAKYYKQKVYQIFETDEYGKYIGVKVTWAGMPEDTQKVLECALMYHFVTSYTAIDYEDEKQVAFISNMWKSARPNGISDEQWNRIQLGINDHIAHDEIYKMELPHMRKVVDSYSEYTYKNELDLYHVDVMDTMSVHMTESKEDKYAGMTYKKKRYQQHIDKLKELGLYEKYLKWRKHHKEVKSIDTSSENDIML